MARFDHYEVCPTCRDSGRDRRGDNLAVYTDGGSHCFSCGRHRSGSFRLPVPVLKETNDTKVLPADFSREVPARAWEWLLQYGLGWKYWTPFVGWSEAHSRLVITCGTPVRFSVGRFIGAGAVEGEKPPRKWNTYGDSHKTVVAFRPEEGRPEGNRIVLVEDVISAHKVGQLTPCIPLFGTKMFPAVVPVLRHFKLPVLMWLDKDQEGHAPRRAASIAMLTGLSVTYTFTNEDPKCLSLSKIGEIVNG